MKDWLHACALALLGLKWKYLKAVATIMLINAPFLSQWAIFLALYLLCYPLYVLPSQYSFLPPLLLLSSLCSEFNG